MLRGLVIRQGFMIAQAILGLVIIGIAVSAIRDLYSLPTSEDAINPNSSAISPDTVLNNAINPRANYQSIIDSKIFGNAAGYIHNAPPSKKIQPVKPVKTEAVDSKLPLTLKGTLYAGEGSRFSSANIVVNEKGVGMKTFFIEDEVITNVFLIKVLKNEVWLRNKNTNPNQDEILKHELDLQIAGKSSTKSGANPTLTTARRVTPSRPTPSGRPSQQKLITLDRKSIVKKIEDEYKRIASTVDIIEEKDKDGNLLGLSTPNVESIGVMNELGFKNGDVLVSINNEKVASQNQMTSLANKYRNSNVVRVGILRAGKPMNFTYRLR